MNVHVADLAHNAHLLHLAHDAHLVHLAECRERKRQYDEDCKNPANERTPAQKRQSKVKKTNALSKICRKYVEVNPHYHVIDEPELFDEHEAQLFDEYYNYLWNRDIRIHPFNMQYRNFYPGVGVWL